MPYYCQGSSNLQVHQGGEHAEKSGQRPAILKSEELSVSSSNIVLYPNPSSTGISEMAVEDETAHAETEYRVYDLSGKEVAKGTTKAFKATLELERGVYVVKIKTPQGWQSKKLIMH